MATGKRYYWIKLKESFMTSDVVDYMMSQPDGANYVVLYQMLCIKTINTDGRLSRQIGEIIIPYDVEKIQRDCKWFSSDTVRVALNMYKAFGLIYEDKDGTLVLADHNNIVGSEMDWAEQKRKQRLKQPEINVSALECGQNADNGVDIVHTEIRDKDIRDKDIDIISSSYEEEVPHSQSESCPYVKIMELYHTICVSFPQIQSIEGSRKKAVGARWRVYKSLDKFEEMFKIAESSDFLKGTNDRNWSADFDWLIKANNMSKVLEHKYDSRKRENSDAQSYPNSSFDTDEFYRAALERAYGTSTPE